MPDSERAGFQSLAGFRSMHLSMSSPRGIGRGGRGGGGGGGGVGGGEGGDWEY